MYQFNNFNRSHARGQNALTEIQMQQIAPSVFAQAPAQNLTSRYTHIPTIDVVRGMQKAGYQPFKVEQSKTRIQDAEHTAKHMIRFRHESNLQAQAGGSIPEIVLINSHDGKSSYQLKAGIFRLVCANGLMVGSECYSTRILHKGDVINDVVSSAEQITRSLPEVMQKSLEWQNIQLNDNQKIHLAHEAIKLKFDNLDGLWMNNLVRAFLRPNRYDDQKHDLWTVFNTVQENLIRGGVRYLKDIPNEYNGLPEIKRNSTRAISNIQENARMNTSLWNVAEQLAVA